MCFSKSPNFMIRYPFYMLITCSFQHDLRSPLSFLVGITCIIDKKIVGIFIRNFKIQINNKNILKEHSFSSNILFLIKINRVLLKIRPFFQKIRGIPFFPRMTILRDVSNSHFRVVLHLTLCSLWNVCMYYLQIRCYFQLIQ